MNEKTIKEALLKGERVTLECKKAKAEVPKSIWQTYSAFANTIGGYQPAQKWLKDRKDMTLSFEDVKHYGSIIYVLQQTERLMGDIDNLMTEQ